MNRTIISEAQYCVAFLKDYGFMSSVQASPVQARIHQEWEKLRNLKTVVTRSKNHAKRKNSPSATVDNDDPVLDLSGAGTDES